MRRALPAAVVVAAAAAVAAVVATGLGLWSGAAAEPPPSRPLTVTTAVSPRSSLFGDSVVAEIDVLVDPRVVDSGSVRVIPSFAPWAVGAPAVASSRAGRLERVRYRYTLSCLIQACLPLHGARVVRLAPVEVEARVAGALLKTRAGWPPYLVGSRLAPADVKAPTLPFRSPSAPPPPSYRVAPGPLADTLTAAAGVLVAAGLALLLREALSAVRARRRRPVIGALEAALRYARESAARSDPRDRRKALDLLAQALEGGLAAAAARLAWDEPAPSPERTLEIAAAAERGGRDEP